MADRPDNRPSIGKEGRAVRRKFRDMKNRIDIQNAAEVARVGGTTSADAPMTGEGHYHLCFEIVGSGLVHPFYNAVYHTRRAAYLEAARLGEESEPNTVWDDNGKVLIETPLVGRTGLFRVIVSVARCIALRCIQRGSPLEGFALPRRVN